MGIAMFTASAFVNPIDQIASFFSSRRARAAVVTRLPVVVLAPTKQAAKAIDRTASNVTPIRPATRPLRVLRVVDRNNAGAGRMVISGRMADVCAELDRLAAIEAANSI